MKAIFLALFFVAVTAAPLPEDASGSDAVEMVVNGVPEGAALDLKDVVDIKLKEHGEDGVVVTDLLHPYSAVGIAEAAAASEAAAAAEAAAAEAAAAAESAVAVDSAVAVESAVAPAAVEPAAPSEVSADLSELAGIVHPVHIVAPPQAIVPEDPAPVVPEPVVLPAPAVPEVVAEQEQVLVPVPAPQMSSQLYNDGLVQVQYNGPEEPGLLSTLQNWFQVVINYFTPESSAPASAGPEPRHYHMH